MGLIAACDCSPQPVAAPCVTAAECAPGQLCFDGICRAPAPSMDGTTPFPDSSVLPGDSALPSSDAGLIEMGACTVPAVPNPFEDPQLELHWRGQGLPFPALEHVVQSPVVIDFIPSAPDAPVVPEMLFLSYQGFSGGPSAVLRVVEGRPPYTTLLTVPGDGMGNAITDVGRTASFRGDTHLAAGDLNGDGLSEVVGILNDGGAAAIRNDGSALWSVGAGQLPVAETTANASVAIADLNMDGLPEVIVGRVVLNGQTGQRLWTGGARRGKNGQGPLSCVADVVPNSPGLEVIAGQSVYSATGDILWDNQVEGFCAVADIVDAGGSAARDGLPEVVVVSDGRLHLLDGATGVERWSRALPGCGGESGRGGAPTVADFDGDGLSEVGVAGSFCYAVFDPGCSAGLPGCTGNGLLWRTTTEDNSSNVTSSTVFDFNGDGTAEVVYNDEQNFLVFAGATGQVLFREPNPSRTRTEQPIVVDVDNDGNAEIVFGANKEAGFAGDAIAVEEQIPGLEIWSSRDDSWVGARQVWNQHTYHIDNIGVVGAVPTPEPPSWMTHNTYRLNLAADNALNAPDLVGNPAPERPCDGMGTLPLCAELANRGDVRVGPVTVTFYAGDPTAGGTEIGSVMSTMNLDRGDREEVCVDWIMAPGTPTPVFVRVDSANAERECIEDNNQLFLGERGCDLVL